MEERIHFFKQEGYFHGKAAFSSELIHKFKTEFDAIFDDKRQRFYARFQGNTQYGANHDVHRWNMLLPTESMIFRSAFFSDDAIFGLLRNVFEGDFALVFFSSDISSPGSAFQTIHQDGNDFAVALNLPLVDADEQNGATHIYPKTHRISSYDAFTNESNAFTDEEILVRASMLNPVSLNLKVGDYTLRDLRLIHRGTPNLTSQHRPYLSSIFLPSSKHEAPTFDIIQQGLDLFKQFKSEAFPTGNIALIDYANTFGRLVMGYSNSDRVHRPISKEISDKLNENALYCLRFAKFEDETLEQRITRNASTSESLLEAIVQAREEFDQLKRAVQ